MCGGSLEIHPCSHVAHLFRTISPYKWGKSFKDILRKNAVRTAEVWMDEYKHIYYERLNYDLVCDQIYFVEYRLRHYVWIRRNMWKIIINLKKTAYLWFFIYFDNGWEDLFYYSNFDQVYIELFYAGRLWRCIR